MNEQEIIELAKKCGAEILEEEGDTPEICFYPVVQLEQFAERIRADERAKAEQQKTELLAEIERLQEKIKDLTGEPRWKRT